MEILIEILLLLMLLLLGLELSKLCRKIKIPSALVLVLLGVILRKVNYLDISSPLYKDLGILALIILIIDSIGHFRVLKWNKTQAEAIKAGIVFMIMNILFLSVNVSYLFGINSTIVSLIFAILMSEIGPEQISYAKNSISNMESYILTPIIAGLIFSLIELTNVKLDYASLFVFGQNILLSLGFGLVCAIVIFGILKRVKSEPISLLLLVIISLTGYVIAEVNGGIGILSVIMVGFVFSNIRIPHKNELLKIEDYAVSSLEVILSILIGYSVSTSIDLTFIFNSFLIFIVIILIRFVALTLVYLNEKPDPRQIRDRVFDCPKGYSTIVIAFVLSTTAAQQIVDITVLVLIFSLLTSWLYEHKYK